MDFLTGMAYWGIILLAIINAFIVLRMKIVIPGEGDDDDDERKNVCGVG